MLDDPITAFKAMQRETWSSFAPTAAFTTPPAARLVAFAGVKAGETVLDVACGTGVVAVTAARTGAKANGLDLTPALLEEARRSATMAGVDIEFTEGDVEALPYPDAAFDVVLSQFGHMFAPRPGLAIDEMLRVLKSGGRIAFSTWPPELLVGRMFTLIAHHLPPPEGVAPPIAWGDPSVVRQRLGDTVRNLEFTRDEMLYPALSLGHYAAMIEQNIGPITAIVAMKSGDAAALAAFRTEFRELSEPYFQDNLIRQSYLMTRAVKR